ncbi:hypothetical protein ACIPJS_04050 [Streptomyces sp. NPDC086783]|uniref:hypothetical protein n=1 Tax=Streptomyces sp. NPDC086783 TaxID=3365758 RepID=UPI003827A595
MKSRAGRRRTPTHRTGGAASCGLSEAVRWAGRLLCWTLAAAMLGAAAEAVLQPTSGWWGVLWRVPWCLTPVWGLTWAVLRKREKSAAGRDRDEEVPEEFGEAA